MTRLYALTNPDIEAVQALRKGLRLSNQQSALIEKINRALLLLDPLDDPVGRRHAAFRFGHEAALAALMLAASRTGGDCKQGTRHWLDEASADIRQVPLKSPFTGQHLLARGLQSGPQIGAIVGEAERLWIEEGLSGDPTIHNSQLERAVKHILD